MLRRRKILGGLIVFLCAGVLIWWFLHSGHVKDEVKKAAEERRRISDIISRVESVAQSLCEKHHAVSGWDKKVDDHDGSATFTLDMQSALMRNDSAPILLLCSLDDIYRDKDGYYARFSTLTNELKPYGVIELTLKCDAAQVGKILDARRSGHFNDNMGFFDQEVEHALSRLSVGGDGLCGRPCFVVARVTEAYQETIKSFSVSIRHNGARDDGDMEGHVESEAPLLAKGECIDFASLAEMTVSWRWRSSEKKQ